MKNPLLDDKYFIPDVEAHVWSDGRIYLYGSYDIRGARNYCSEEYHVFSSADMREWTDHGVSFTFSDAKWAADCPYRALYAPDCAERNGNYYLYYCIPDGRCGVAVS
ncbi:MAG: family 43 glycosylhydrolase, partial [Clostridia bacterium]|nr:family 43 glycosylhydrolase [Clostridia bacterium]